MINAPQPLAQSYYPWLNIIAVKGRVRILCIYPYQVRWLDITTLGLDGVE